MRDVLGVISRILFYVFVVSVFAWTATLTLGLAARLLPGDSITPFFALALFDGGALAWCLVFLFTAKGLPQRAIALLAMVIDLSGVIGCTIAELFLGGQNLTAIPADLGRLVVWGIGLFTAINLIASYMFHISDPTEMQEIRLRTLEDRVTDEALNQVEADIKASAGVLGQQIASRMRSDVLARLHILPTVIDVQARDAQPLYMPAPQNAINGNSPVTRKATEDIQTAPREPLMANAVTTVTPTAINGTDMPEAGVDPTSARL